MKKVLYILMAACMTLGLQSCDKLGELLSLDKTIDITVNVDRSALSATNIQVQTFAESIDLEGSSCTIKVFDNGKPQLIAVTDNDGHLLMLYRGAVRENQAVTVNAASSAMALVTFNPLFGPVPSSALGMLQPYIQNNPNYAPFAANVNTVIANGGDLTSTANAAMLTSLETLLTSLSGQALSGYQDISNTIRQGSALETYPLLSTTEGNIISLEAITTCPSYSGTLTNTTTGHETALYISPNVSYSVADYFSNNISQSSNAPLNIALDEEGDYVLSLACNTPTALVDFYARVMNNILNMLGAEIGGAELEILVGIARDALEQQGIELTDYTSAQVMDVVSGGYDAAIEYLRANNIITSSEANWALGSTLMRRLVDIYVQTRESTDHILRSAWTFSVDLISGDGGSTIDCYFNYSAANGIVPTSGPAGE